MSFWETLIENITRACLPPSQYYDFMTAEGSENVFELLTYVLNKPKIFRNIPEYSEYYPN